MQPCVLSVAEGFALGLGNFLKCAESLGCLPSLKRDVFSRVVDLDRVRRHHKHYSRSGSSDTSRVETKIFVFVFPRKFRENLFSLFAKKAYEKLRK
jgi:hypothetical protein